MGAIRAIRDKNEKMGNMEWETTEEAKREWAVKRAGRSLPTLISSLMTTWVTRS